MFTGDIWPVKILNDFLIDTFGHSV